MKWVSKTSIVRLLDDLLGRGPACFTHKPEFIDLPPADPIAFHLERAANPNLTYGEYVRRWQENTRRIREAKK